MRRASACVAVTALVVGVLAAVAPAGAAPAVPAAVAHAPRIPGPTGTSPGPGLHAATVQQQWTSTNWSGYATTGAGYTAATGSWRVPPVNPPSAKKGLRHSYFSSTWVGIDGFANSSLIQAGTEQDWINDAPVYQAWWEILPAAETPIATITVHPGDLMVVSITRGTPKWTITVTDSTTGQSFGTQQTYSGPATSAEWIHERPFVGRRLAQLPADGNAIFDNGTVNGANPGLVIGDSGTMFKGKHAISTPSLPDHDTDGFAVAYGAIAPAPPSS
jgi:hypothetical protein